MSMRNTLKEATFFFYICVYRNRVDLTFLNLTFSKLNCFKLHKWEIWKNHFCFLCSEENNSLWKMLSLSAKSPSLSKENS